MIPSQSLMEISCTISESPINDDYGNIIISGQKFIQAKFLEKTGSKKNAQRYNLTNRMTYVYSSSVIYPFVNYTMEGCNYVINDLEMCEIIAYAEKYGIM